MNTIYIGSDHGGFEHKKLLIEELQASNYQVTDCGAHIVNSTDDYTDFAAAVARAVREDKGSKGILLCRSGEGMEMAANKVPGIRAALVWREDVARETRKDNDANVLVLPSDFIGSEEILTIAKTFLETDFSNEDRHIRRLEKITAIEKARYEN